MVPSQSKIVPTFFNSAPQCRTARQKPTALEAIGPEQGGTVASRRYPLTPAFARTWGATDSLLLGQERNVDDAG